MRKTCICGAPRPTTRPFCGECWATLTTDDQEIIRYSDPKVRRRVILRCEQTLMENVRDRLHARLAAMDGTAAATRQAAHVETLRPRA